MSVKIDRVAVARPWVNLIPEGSIRQTSRAAKRCLRKAGVEAVTLDLLIHVGVYRDEHIVEPAIASLIQRKIRNTFPRKCNSEILDGCGGTFSFDVNNGGCGLLTGIWLVDDFLQSGGIRKAMVVTGDAEPYSKQSEGFGFARAAVAILLSEAEEGWGFVKFQTDTFPEYLDAFESRISWTSWKNKKKDRNVLVVNSKEEYADLCAECATKSMRRFFSEADFNPSDIDLIIPSQSPAGFVSSLRSQYNWGDKIIDAGENRGQFHTAGPGIALEKSWNDGRFNKAHHVLFISVGSGITTALALYRNGLRP
jgi:3-oxoacyl-[acyl-carrier-protein] synthase-3